MGKNLKKLTHFAAIYATLHTSVTQIAVNSDTKSKDLYRKIFSKSIGFRGGNPIGLIYLQPLLLYKVKNAVRIPL